MELYELTVHELLDKLSKKEITLEDITKSYINRIKEKEDEADDTTNSTDDSDENVTNTSNKVSNKTSNKTTSSAYSDDEE